MTDPTLPLGEAITQFTVEAEHNADDVIDHDIILVWTNDKRVKTGADLLGRLFRGIAKQKNGSSNKDSMNFRFTKQRLPKGRQQLWPLKE
jgi:hypothetical protein